MKLVYLPALQPHAIESRWTRSPIHQMDRRLMGTAGYHPYGMTSFAHGGSQQFAWEPHDSVMGDSGGFSERTRGLLFDPQAVLRWQILTGCKVGVILDSPPWGRWSEFRECLERTVARTKAALPVYLKERASSTSFRWWGVVQGRSLDELEQWWRAISRVYPFTDEGEGWAFRPAENTADAVRRVFTFVESKALRRVHLFATGDHYAVEAVCFAGPRAGVEWVSIDTTSTVADGKFRLLRIPRAYGPPRKTRDPLVVRSFMVNKCPCVSCKLLREDLKERPDLVPTEPRAIIDSIYLKHRLTFHNTLSVVEEFAELQRRYVESGRMHTC